MGHALENVCTVIGVQKSGTVRHSVWVIWYKKPAPPWATPTQQSNKCLLKLWHSQLAACLPISLSEASLNATTIVMLQAAAAVAGAGAWCKVQCFEENTDAIGMATPAYYWQQTATP
jgi:hypothetical protein